MSGIITVLFGAMFASAFAKYQFSGEVNMFCASALDPFVRAKNIDVNCACSPEIEKQSCEFSTYQLPVCTAQGGGGRFKIGNL